jgi:hypothetical protein
LPHCSSWGGLLAVGAVHGQPVPAAEENIPYLVTFGGNSLKSWGDDDFCQTFFFVVPKNTSVPIYLRVFDPGCGGSIDEPKNGYDTVTGFSVYGGKGCISEADARNTEPVGKYRSGNLLASRDFRDEAQYDGQWWIPSGPSTPTVARTCPSTAAAYSS